MSETQRNGEINMRVQDMYDRAMKTGAHGHYETMFRVVQFEREDALKPFIDWYDADQADAITITRAEMGVLIGRPPPPQRMEG